MDSTINFPNIPYTGRIGSRDGKFIPHEQVRIVGEVQQTVDYDFNIKLQCGLSSFPQDDIAIQISVRFNGCVSLNSMINGSWNEEKSISSQPIKQGENFEIVILCEPQHYKVFINNQHICDYPHSISHNKITHLCIDGSVSIHQISYESKSSNLTDDKLNPSDTSNNGGVLPLPEHNRYSDGTQFIDRQLPPSYDDTLTNSLQLQQLQELQTQPNRISYESPPPYVPTLPISNNDNPKPYPVQEMHTGYPHVYQTQILQPQTYETGVVNGQSFLPPERRGCFSKKTSMGIGSVAFVLIIILIIFKKFIFFILSN